MVLACWTLSAVAFFPSCWIKEVTCEESSSEGDNWATCEEGSSQYSCMSSETRSILAYDESKAKDKFNYLVPKKPSRKQTRKDNENRFRFTCCSFPYWNKNATGSCSIWSHGTNGDMYPAATDCKVGTGDAKDQKWFEDGKYCMKSCAKGSEKVGLGGLSIVTQGCDVKTEKIRLGDAVVSECEDYGLTKANACCQINFSDGKLYIMCNKDGFGEDEPKAGDFTDALCPDECKRVPTTTTTEDTVAEDAVAEDAVAEDTVAEDTVAEDTVAEASTSTTTTSTSTTTTTTTSTSTTTTTTTTTTATTTGGQDEATSHAVKQVCFSAVLIVVGSMV